MDVHQNKPVPPELPPKTMEKEARACHEKHPIVLFLGGFALYGMLLMFSYMTYPKETCEALAACPTDEQVETQLNNQEQQSTEMVNNNINNSNLNSEPFTPNSHVFNILGKIVDDLQMTKLRKFICKPSDVHNPAMHKIPPAIKPVKVKREKSEEPPEDMVVYIAVGLLLASLGAALLELYKAKGDAVRNKNKPALSRRVSLADLTVLRHTRKENMRRDSFYIGGSGGGGHDSNSTRLLGGKNQLLRRCSFPVFPHEIASDGTTRSQPGSRRTSYGDSDAFSKPQEHRHSHFRLVRRH